MRKIYDCSNSIKRPHHRGGKGPLENDIIRHLKEYCNDYNCMFVDNPYEGDVIITNDVFPNGLPDRPKIKRMDGIFWRHCFLDRNIKLNKAAIEADHVIFISEFSKNSFFNLYNLPLKNYSVVLNQADPKIFHNKNYVKEEFSLITTATSWLREEKRLKAILDLANNIEENIYMIGVNDSINVPNIKFVGYLDTPEKIAEELNKHSAFINFSYRDAAPKTVQQALCCGLPVYYANSGGVPESVENYGYGIEDIVQANFEEKTPSLDINNIINGYSIFKQNLQIYENNLKNRDNASLFKNMLKGYFKIIINI
jgi:glycosyltransferase involved in cell wall biosynthesis